MANSAPTDDSEAAAQLVAVDGLGLDLVEAIRTSAGNLSKPGEHRSTIDVGVLEELIGLEIARFDLPLIGDGTNGGLLDLGDLAAAGLLNGYAAAPGPVTATAASGAVGADGALDLDAGSSTEMAHLDATALLEQLGL
ncbi:choice-of-anchor G family protein, partial [uncultured Georgenia sp.]|uniref:choice-of-anchor G family protein n=1 Tax=uncultured Georgenia sp. TaxID=378209 RepID=UPI002623DB49